MILQKHCRKTAATGSLFSLGDISLFFRYDSAAVVFKAGTDATVTAAVVSHQGSSEMFSVSTSSVGRPAAVPPPGPLGGLQSIITAAAH